MSGRRRHRHEGELDEEDEKWPVEHRPVDWLRLARMIVGSLTLGGFLLFLLVAPLPLGSNRDWAWAPELMALGGVAILCALGSRGFQVEPDERWPLLALLICFLAFTFVGLLQLSTYAPPTGSAPFYARAQALLGQAHATVPTLSVDATRNALLRCLSCVLVFVIARALLREPARAGLMVQVFLLSGVLVMIYALMQQATSGGCYVGSLLKKQGDYTNDRCLMSGTFANSNTFGCFAGMAFAAAVALVLQKRRRRRALDAEDGDDDSNLTRVLRRMSGAVPIYLALAVLFLGAQLFSSSRAAFAITVPVVVVLVALAMRGRWRSAAQMRWAIVAGGVIGVAMLALAGGAMLSKVSLLGEAGNFNRTAIWSSSLRAAEASPWLGWGLGTYPEIYAVYQPLEIKQANDKAHSTPIELLVEAGWAGAVPGVLMAVIPWGVCLAGAWRRQRYRELLVAAVAVPGIAMLHSAVDFSLQIPAVGFVTAAFLGMGWAQTFHRTPSRRLYDAAEIN